MADDLDKQATTKKRPGRWKPGESGNAKGRPVKEQTFVHHLAQLAQQSVDGDPQHRTRLQLLGEMAWAKSLRNDKDAILWANFVMDRMYGKPVPVTEMPQVVVNQVTVVEQPASFDSLTEALRTLVKADFLPVEALARFLPTRGNGHDDGHG